MALVLGVGSVGLSCAPVSTVASASGPSVSAASSWSALCVRGSACVGVLRGCGVCWAASERRSEVRKVAGVVGVDVDVDVAGCGWCIGRWLECTGGFLRGCGVYRVFVDGLKNDRWMVELRSTHRHTSYPPNHKKPRTYTQPNGSNTAPPLTLQ